MKYIQMANRYENVELLIMQEMKIKTTRIYCLTSERLAITRKTKGNEY